MKIISIDNFDRDMESDHLIASGIASKDVAEVMARALNDRFCNQPASPRYYIAVEDDRELRTFEP